MNIGLDTVLVIVATVFVTNVANLIWLHFFQKQVIERLAKLMKRKAD